MSFSNRNVRVYRDKFKCVAGTRASSLWAGPWRRILRDSENFLHFPCRDGIDGRSKTCNLAGVLGTFGSVGAALWRWRHAPSENRKIAALLASRGGKRQGRAGKFKRAGALCQKPQAVGESWHACTAAWWIAKNVPAIPESREGPRHRPASASQMRAARNADASPN